MIHLFIRCRRTRRRKTVITGGDHMNRNSRDRLSNYEPVEIITSGFDDDAAASGTTADKKKGVLLFLAGCEDEVDTGTFNNL